MREGTQSGYLDTCKAKIKKSLRKRLGLKAQPKEEHAKHDQKSHSRRKGKKGATVEVKAKSGMEVGKGVTIKQQDVGGKAGLTKDGKKNKEWKTSDGKFSIEKSGQDRHGSFSHEGKGSTWAVTKDGQAFGKPHTNINKAVGSVKRWYDFQ